MKGETEVEKEKMRGNSHNIFPSLHYNFVYFERGRRGRGERPAMKNNTQKIILIEDKRIFLTFMKIYDELT